MADGVYRSRRPRASEDDIWWTSLDVVALFVIRTKSDRLNGILSKSACKKRSGLRLYTKEEIFFKSPTDAVGIRVQASLLALCRIFILSVIIRLVRCILE